MMKNNYTSLTTSQSRNVCMIVSYVPLHIGKIVGDARDAINYVTDFKINKYSLSCLLFSEIVYLITSLIKTIDLLS